MPARNELLIRRAFDAFGERDLKTLCELADPELEVSTITGVLAQRETPYAGHAGLADYLEDVGKVWDELELIPGEFHELGPDRVLVFGRVRARRGTTMIDAPNAWVWTLRSDRVRSVEVYGDPDTAAKLLG